MKDLCQKRKLKLIFRGAYRLSATGIVQCLEIINVGCNLKQFDGLLDLTDPDLAYFTTDLRHCRKVQPATGKFYSAPSDPVTGLTDLSDRLPQLTHDVSLHNV